MSGRIEEGPGVSDDESVATRYLETTQRLVGSVDVHQVARVVRILREARDQGRTVFIVGNGGSASNASHFATDLSNATHRDGAPRLRAVSLTDNSAWMTAISNDHGYDRVFSGQLDGLLRRGDVLVAISASGSSPNVLEAVRLARERGATTVALVGFDGGQLLGSADAAIHVVSDHGAYGPVEDTHLAIQHLVTLCLARA